MQHYSKTVSFQEIRCRGEVNIYLHNLTLLSDCLIFPSDFPSSFTPPPGSASKHVVPGKKKKKDMTPRGFTGLSDPDDVTCALHYSWSSLSVFLHPASQLPRLPHLHILLQHLQRLPYTPSSLLIPSYQDSCPPYPTPHSFFFYCYYCYYPSLHQHGPLRLLP